MTLILLWNLPPLGEEEVHAERPTVTRFKYVDRPKVQTMRPRSVMVPEPERTKMPLAVRLLAMEWMLD